MERKELELWELVNSARRMARSIRALKVPGDRHELSTRGDRMQWALAAEMISSLADSLEDMARDRSEGDS